MMHTTLHYGMPSYTIRSDKVQAYISVLCGHTTATFTHGKREIFPYFVSPWWHEAFDPDMLSTMRLLRGDYFCFPFGINAEPYKEVQHPLHGKTANNCWDFVALEERRDRGFHPPFDGSEPRPGEGRKDHQPAPGRADHLHPSQGERLQRQELLRKPPQHPVPGHTGGRIRRHERAADGVHRAHADRRAGQQGVLDPRSPAWR